MSSPVHLRLGSCVIRPWVAEDLPSLVRHANNRNIWINLRDRFPHPYTEADGRAFLAHITGNDSHTVWAIEVNGEAAGGIGVVLMSDVERVSAEIGYWLGQSYWGRGSGHGRPQGADHGGVQSVRLDANLRAAVCRQSGARSKCWRRPAMRSRAGCCKAPSRMASCAIK